MKLLQVTFEHSILCTLWINKRTEEKSCTLFSKLAIDSGIGVEILKLLR
jgi:hypothetical protein